MTDIRVVINMDGQADPEVAEAVAAGRIVHLTGGWKIGALAGGMDSGKASVMIVADIGDGRFAVLETSLRNMKVAVDTLWAVHGAGDVARGEG